LVKFFGREIQIARDHGCHDPKASRSPGQSIADKIKPFLDERLIECESRTAAREQMNRHADEDHANPGGEATDDFGVGITKNPA